MKSATIPQTPVEPKLLHNLEAVLLHGETISSFVAEAVRHAVALRHTQSRFRKRADEALARFLDTGESRTSEEVLAKLQKKLDDRRSQMS